MPAVPHGEYIEGEGGKKGGILQASLMLTCEENATVSSILPNELAYCLLVDPECHLRPF